MDKFSLKHVPPEERERWQSSLVFKLCVDGEFLLESDYTIELDSFFDSLGAKLGMLEFIGGCGVPACCAEGRNVISTQKHWILYDIQESFITQCRFDWNDVLYAAENVMDLIEEYKGRVTQEQLSDSQIERYKRKVELLRGWIGSGNFEIFEIQPKINFFESFQARFPLRLDRIQRSIDENLENVKIADMALAFSAPNKIEIGILGSNGTDYRFFTREQIQSFLENELSKDLLVVCLSDAAASDETVRDFLDTLGYAEYQFCRGSSKLLFETRCSARERLHLKSSTPRIVLCGWSEQEFDIGIGSDSSWLSALQKKFEVRSPDADFLSKEELISFIQQDTRRNRVLFVLPFGMDFEDNPIQSLRLDQQDFEVAVVQKGSFKISDYTV